MPASTASTPRSARMPLCSRVPRRPALPTVLTSSGGRFARRVSRRSSPPRAWKGWSPLWRWMRPGRRSSMLACVPLAPGFNCVRRSGQVWMNRSSFAGSIARGSYPAAGLAKLAEAKSFAPFRQFNPPMKSPMSVEEERYLADTHCSARRTGFAPVAEKPVSIAAAPRTTEWFRWLKSPSTHPPRSRLAQTGGEPAPCLIRRRPCGKGVPRANCPCATILITTLPVSTGRSTCEAT